MILWKSVSSSSVAALAPPGVRDNVECVLRVLGDDGIVDDTSGLVEEDAQSGCIGGEC